MIRASRIVLLSVLAVAVTGNVALAESKAQDSSTSAAPFRIRLESLADSFDQPVFVTGAGDGTGDVYVAEKRGSIVRVQPDHSIASELFLDISEKVLDHHERGLLGLAFHPDYAENGRFYVAYTRRSDSATVLSEFAPLDEPLEDPADEEWTNAEPDPVKGNERSLLVIAQPFAWHQAGMLAFDHEGMLLFSVGDGGSVGDPMRHSLDTSSLLGKLLRVDVDAGWPYAIPLTNGFVWQPGARPEINAIGLRNPWRFSVDRETGDIYIADVGQDAWEEINVLPRGVGGVSFGWPDMEGIGCYADVPCNPGQHVLPALTYPHVDSEPETAYCAVIGGYAYRGIQEPLLVGHYLYADYCGGTIWAVEVDDLLAGEAAPAVVGRLDPAHGQVLSFGQDDAGELYVATSGGQVMRVHADPAP